MAARVLADLLLGVAAGIFFGESMARLDILWSTRVNACWGDVGT